MGVTKEILSEGDGKTYPQAGQKLVMHYTGTLQDGTVFDSSVRKGRPFKFTIGKGQVIRGWDEGVMTMSVGEKSKLTITGDYAYGPAGIDGVIPPNATLIFEVELLQIAPPGVTKEVLKAGDGKTYPQAGQQLTMHYTGTLQDGTVFDSSVRKGRPFKFTIGVGQVIQGWDEGVMTMSVGEKSKLTITGDYAYGPAGIDGVIPPNATLIFEVELLQVGA